MKELNKRQQDKLAKYYSNYAKAHSEHIKKYQKEYRDAHKQKTKEYNKTYYIKNTSFLKEQTKQWREDNREYSANYMHEYHQMYSQQISEEKIRKKRERNNMWMKRNRKRYYKANPEKIKARELASKIPITGKTCCRCGTDKNILRHHPDYKKPLEIIILCARCHSREHGRDLYGVYANGEYRR